MKNQISRVLIKKRLYFNISACNNNTYTWPRESWHSTFSSLTRKAYNSSLPRGSSRTWWTIRSLLEITIKILFSHVVFHLKNTWYTYWWSIFSRISFVSKASSRPRETSLSLAPWRSMISSKTRRTLFPRETNWTCLTNRTLRK